MNYQTGRTDPTREPEDTEESTDGGDIGSPGRAIWQSDAPPVGAKPRDGHLSRVLHVAMIVASAAAGWILALWVAPS